MQSTQPTLLERLRGPGDAEAWNRFIELYSPLLFEWARRNGVPEQDAPDLVQNVLVLLIRRLPHYQPSPRGSFRGWLFTMLKNCWLDDCRQRTRKPTVAGGGPRDQAAAEDPIADLTEVEYRGYLMRRILTVIQRDFPESTWRAFHEHVLERRPAPAVAARLGVSTNAIYLARGRILKRLREELAGFLD